MRTGAAHASRFARRNAAAPENDCRLSHRPNARAAQSAVSPVQARHGIAAIAMGEVAGTLRSAGGVLQTLEPTQIDDRRRLRGAAFVHHGPRAALLGVAA